MTYRKRTTALPRPLSEQTAVPAKSLPARRAQARESERHFTRVAVTPTTADVTTTTSPKAPKNRIVGGIITY